MTSPATGATPWLAFAAPTLLGLGIMAALLSLVALLLGQRWPFAVLAVFGVVASMVLVPLILIWSARMGTSVLADESTPWEIVAGSLWLAAILLWTRIMYREAMASY